MSDDFSNQVRSIAYNENISIGGMQNLLKAANHIDAQEQDIHHLKKYLASAETRITELERELKIMGGRSARIRWAEGHGPDDPARPIKREP